MKYLILGATGTLGRALTKQILKDPYAEVIGFSRDELKQKEMAAEFNSSQLSFMLGDIRDPSSLWRAMEGVDDVFHVAALKHIDTLEANPEESIRTNVIGTVNVADGAIRAGVKHVVFSSTDKAVEPVNVYGMSKGISEKLLLNRNKTQTKTYFSVYRWANVMGSRGSAIHAFARTLKSERKAYVTDVQMTRFWLRIEDAARFMLETYTHRTPEIKIPPMKSSSVLTLVEAVAKECLVDPYEVQVTGVRPGEKIHESIEAGRSSANGPFYTVDEMRDLVRPFL